MVEEKVELRKTIKALEVSSEKFISLAEKIREDQLNDEEKIEIFDEMSEELAFLFEQSANKNKAQVERLKEGL